MKSVQRITALAVPLCALVVGNSLYATVADHRAPRYPLRTPVTPDALRQRGALRFAIPRGSLDRFSRPAESADFDYDLLRQFANDYHLKLVERDVSSDDEAARMLRIGLADAAVLGVGWHDEEDFVPARPCPAWGHHETPATDRPTLFASSDSPELVGLLGAAAVRLAAAGQDRSIYAIYCDGGPSSAMAESLPSGSKITRYAGVIAKYADPADLDWRLVAALIFEESRFEERAVSSAGARGLMQLMPWISTEVGVSNIAQPEANIQAGILYLRRLAEQFPDARASDRIALVLASYLIGPNHVFDAQDLARERGLDPQTWHRNMDTSLPLLEDGHVNIRTRSGYAHGRLAVDYVNRILDRYDHYRRHLESDPDLRAAGPYEHGHA
jgi:membrane-bound lytic murein transglycosylase MltF